MTIAAVCIRTMRRRSNSATVERLIDTWERALGHRRCWLHIGVPSCVGLYARSSSSFSAIAAYRTRIITKIRNHDTFAVLNMGNTSLPTEQPLTVAASWRLISAPQTIGLAVSDELGITAQGLPTLHRTNKRNDFDHSASNHQTTCDRRVCDGTAAAHERQRPASSPTK